MILSTAITGTGDVQFNESKQNLVMGVVIYILKGMMCLSFAFCVFLELCEFVSLHIRHGFSMIFNTSERPAWLRVAEGSHMMSHDDQYL